MPSRHYKRKSLSKSKKNGKKTIKRSSHSKRTRINLKNMKGGTNNNNKIIKKYLICNFKNKNITLNFSQSQIKKIKDKIGFFTRKKESKTIDIIQQLGKYFINLECDKTQGKFESELYCKLDDHKEIDVYDEGYYRKRAWKDIDTKDIEDPLNHILNPKKIDSTTNSITV